MFQKEAIGIQVGYLKNNPKGVMVSVCGKCQSVEVDKKNVNKPCPEMMS